MDIIRINNLQLLAIKKNELGNVEYFILNSNLDERDESVCSTFIPNTSF